MPVDKETLDELVSAILNDKRMTSFMKDCVRKELRPRVNHRPDLDGSKYVRIHRVVEQITQKDLLPLFKELLAQKALEEPDFYPTRPIKEALGITTLKINDAELIAAVSLMDFIRPEYGSEDDYGHLCYRFRRTRPTTGDRRKCITLPQLLLYQQVIREDLSGLMLDIEEYRDTETLKEPYRLAKYEYDPDIIRYMGFLDYATQVNEDEWLKIRKELQ